MLKKIDHIGIAVKDLEAQIRYYEEVLGIPLKEIEEVEEQKVKTAIFPIGEIKIELLQATSPESPIARFIEKRGEGIHHIAYQTDNIDKCLSHLTGHDITLINEEPGEGADNMLISFLHPKSTFGVLTEICQPKK